MINRSIFVVMVVLLSGCASYSDKEISKIETAKGVLLQDELEQKKILYFKNIAIYKTKESVYEGKEKLSYILGVYTNAISSVKISAASREEIVVEFLDNNSTTLQIRRLVAGHDFEIKRGEVVIRSKTTCGSHFSPGVGCQWSSVRLFEDKGGNLVAIQSSGGAGLVGIIPVSVGADYVSVFARSENSLVSTAP
jgi:hypothetical protein